MIIEVGEKVHVVYRSLYENSTRRHFIGVVVSAQDALCRIEGYAFVYDAKKTEFEKKDKLRTTIIDLAESGYVVNIVDTGVDIKDVHYRYMSGVGLMATDGKDFLLDINEFGSRS
ncbi:hypothetical protein [Pseudohalioglobus lutimaris]|uniref:Uncharacterized protein n=1 Tax=Pseudohalioglobus lutimaris TaxID=1737061 RepID=A0A2N5WXY1_9GAMM|nr:hypothetical protein [Pseudohalioglobus lutimaris]PLW67085.1 hypothetical protein C0039_18890 [Pseudohalioglobus lutimaris]